MNLKEAARALGVHYQTAYRSVRSGELGAVRVGTVYEVSEASIARFRSLRQAERRVLAAPDDATDGAQQHDSLVEVFAALRLSPEARIRATAHHTASSIGDTAVIWLADASGTAVEPVAWTNRCAAHDAILSAAIQESDSRSSSRTPVEWVMQTGRSLHVAFADQALVRNATPPALRCWLDVMGCHSIIVVPIRSAEQVIGAIWLSRDRAGAPYRPEDVAAAEADAELLGGTLAASPAIASAWRTRAEVQALVQRELDREPNLDLGERIRGVLERRPDVCGVVDASNMCIVALTPEARRSYPGLEVGASFVEVVAEQHRGRVVDLFERMTVGEIDYGCRRIVVTVAGVRQATMHVAIVRRANDATGYLVIALS